MSEKNKREAFASLANRFKKNRDDKPLLVRPPYNEDKSLFHKYCTECIDTPCVSICEEEIIKLDGDKIPFLVFEKNGCTFCEECANACPHDVLVLHDDTQQRINAKFSIDVSTCLAWNGVMCSSCRDVCYEDAISFLGVFRPTIDMQKCTGCGFCYGVCPPYSIKFSAIKEK